MPDDTKAYDILTLDSVETPVDIISRKVVREVELPFYAISTGSYREGRRFSYYSEGFDSYCFQISLGGSGEVTYRGRTVRMDPGDMFLSHNLLPARTRTRSDEWSFRFVNFLGSFAPRFEELWNHGGAVMIHTDHPAHYEEIIQHISQEINRPYLSADLTVSACITSLLTDALNERLTREEGICARLYPDWLAEAAGILSSPGGEDWKIADLASKYFMEQNNFIRQFKKYLGKTPKEYQLSCRLERAAVMLRSGEVGVMQAAEATGFSSPSYFAKVFRETFGVSPSDYREQLFRP